MDEKNVQFYNNIRTQILTFSINCDKPKPSDMLNDWFGFIPGIMLES